MMIDNNHPTIYGFFNIDIRKNVPEKIKISINNNFLIGIFSSILWTILDTRNRTTLDSPITNQMYTIGYHNDSKYGYLNAFVLLDTPYKMVIKIITGHNLIHFVSFNTLMMPFGFFRSFSFFGVIRDMATINHMTSTISPI